MSTNGVSMRRQRFGCPRLSHPHLTCSLMPFPDRSPPRPLTAAASGGLKPAPTSRLRRASLHLAYSMTRARLLDTTNRPAGPVIRQQRKRQAAKLAGPDLEAGDSVGAELQDLHVYIPDAHERTTLLYGWYSNWTRGDRRQRGLLGEAPRVGVCRRHSGPGSFCGVKRAGRSMARSHGPSLFPLAFSPPER